MAKPPGRHFPGDELPGGSTQALSGIPNPQRARGPCAAACSRSHPWSLHSMKPSRLQEEATHQLAAQSIPAFNKLAAKEHAFPKLPASLGISSCHELSTMAAWEKSTQIG